MNNKLEGSWSSSGDIIMAWIHMVAIKMERSKWVIFKSEVLIDSLDGGGGAWQWEGKINFDSCSSFWLEQLGDHR